MSNVNKGKTGNVKVAGAIRSISDDNIAVYAGDVYDDNLEKNQRDINQKVFDEIAHTKEEMEHFIKDSLTANYNPTLDSATKVTTSIGSIKAGSTLSDLEGKSYSEIIDAILVNETWNDPGYTHTINLGNVTSLVKVGSSVVVPSVSAIWNNNIQSDSEKTITTNLVKTIIGSSETVYNKSGNSTFVLNYSYPEGYYNITSNLGNTKIITVPSKTNGSISKTVTATYPWFINNSEQTLVAIGSSKTIEVSLTGSPSIKVPFANSTVSIQADLGFGWMDVSWDVTTDDTNLGNAVDETVPYKIYSKPDSYSTSVKHKITITLNK